MSEKVLDTTYLGCVRHLFLRPSMHLGCGARRRRRRRTRGASKPTRSCCCRSRAWLRVCSQHGRQAHGGKHFVSAIWQTGASWMPPPGAAEHELQSNTLDVMARFGAWFRIALCAYVTLSWKTEGAPKHAEVPLTTAREYAEAPLTRGCFRAQR